MVLHNKDVFMIVYGFNLFFLSDAFSTSVSTDLKSKVKQIQSNLSRRSKSIARAHPITAPTFSTDDHSLRHSKCQAQRPQLSAADSSLIL